jgi:hypothetical protein
MITIKPASLQNTTKMMLKSFMTTFLAVKAVLAVSGVVFFNMETKDYLEKIKLEEKKIWICRGRLLQRASKQYSQTSYFYPNRTN